MTETLSAGDEAIVEIEGLAYGGNGVGRIGRRVVFTPYAAPGDRAVVVIRDVRRTYLVGDIKEIIVPSAERTQPRCPLFYRCGGCSYQHLNYAAQCEWKERQVRDSLTRIGGMVNPPVESLIPSPEPYRYRGKAEYHWAPGDGGALSMGFLDVSGRALIDVVSCHIVRESIDEAVFSLRERCRIDDAAPRDRRLIFWSGYSYRESHFIERQVKEKTFRVPYSGFFQANLVLAERLVDEVMALAAPGPSDTVLDCYCGAGLFSLF
ncbi:MAG: class I SAM-dependent RNA methyltransferase, partial [Deltaproteobacteria bacterium]|nr:class I SAM-dependent RNA methyltransferase [Deltaproteobacteria bacterium]